MNKNISYFLNTKGKKRMEEGEKGKKKKKEKKSTEES